MGIDLDPGSALAASKETGMFTMEDRSTRLSLGTLGAVAVVALGVLVLDVGHLGTLPQGVVEVGQMTTFTE
jgi:hypothetical protein